MILNCPPPPIITKRKEIIVQIVVRTETWNTVNGNVAKAVVRTVDGKFLGATNQTKALSASSFQIVGR
jgi:hypothetical protein